MKIKSSIFFIILFYLLATLGCPSRNSYKNSQVSAKDINPNIITDSTGVVFTIPAEFSRIISLAPYITENLKILESEDKLAGKTDYCRTVRNIASVGNMLEPSIEEIISLQPDLVLATKEGNRFAVVQKLREMNINVFVFGESNTWNNISGDFLALGRLVNKADKAGKIISRIQDDLNNLSFDKTIDESGREAKRAINGSPILPKFFVQLNIKPLMTAGRNTFINEIINLSGGYNIASDSILPWPTMNVEEIIRINPDVIIVCDMGDMTGEARKIWTEEKYAGIEAVKNNKVFVMDSDLLCQPTPLNFINAVKRFREHIKTKTQ